MRAFAFSGAGAFIGMQGALYFGQDENTAMMWGIFIGVMAVMIINAPNKKAGPKREEP